MEKAKGNVKSIGVSREEAQYIEQLLEMSDSPSTHGELKLEDYGICANETISTHTVVFDNGFETDIMFIATDDDVYINAVLFNEKGNEIQCLDPCYEFLGEFEFEVAGIPYIVLVEENFVTEYVIIADKEFFFEEWEKEEADEKCRELHKEGIEISQYFRRDLVEISDSEFEEEWVELMDLDEILSLDL